MSDLSDLQAAQAIKVIGADATGLETNPMDVDVNGCAKTTSRTLDGAGTSITSTAQGGKQALDVAVVSQTSSVNDISQTGTIAANGQTVGLSFGGRATFNFQLTGTWVGTILFEGTLDGSTYYTLEAIPVGAGAVVASTTVNGAWSVESAGFSNLRARSTAWTSGTASVYILGSIQSNDIEVYNTTPGNLQTVSRIQDSAGSSITNGQKTMANSVPVVVASDQSAIPISAVSLPLPTGAATSANQSTEIISLQLIDDLPHAQNAALVKGVPVMGQLDDAATVVATEDNVAVARITAQRAVHTNLRNNAGTEIGTSGAPVRTDPTGTTAQPVTDNAGSLTVDTPQLAATLGQKTMANSAAVVIASDQSSVPISAASLPLPTGAATEATLVKLPLGQASTTSGQSGVLAQGAVTTAAPAYTTGQTDPLSLTTAGALRVDGSAVTQPVSAASLPLPTGAATSANQTTEITALQIIDDVPTAQNAAFVKGVPVMGQLDDTSTTVATEDNIAVARITAQRALHTNLRNNAGTEIGTSSNPVRVDPTGTTAQPMSLAGIVDSGNTTVANLGIGGVFTGTWTDILTYNNVVITVAPDQASANLGFVVQWSNNGSTVHSADSFSIAANAKKQYSFGRLSRYYRVVYTNGSVAQATFSLQSILCVGSIKPSSHRAADSIVDDDDAELVKAIVTGKSTQSGNYVNIAVDDSGRLVTSNLTGFGSDFAFGDVTTSSLTRVLVNRTAYIEQISNAQRSIASSSANDTSAGTGARTLKIFYYDSSGAGPFSETMTLNGTSFVNTVSTTICYIEQITVITAGSTGSNVGTITLKAATAGGGVTIGTMVPTDNQTFWCHHYIATAKTCNITGISCGHNGTTVGSGALFTVNALTIGVANAVETQVSDFVRLYGQTSTFARNYSSPIVVTGPARLQVYVTPETSSSTTYRAAFDFFEP